MDIYREISRLNPGQKEAVMHIDGPLLILAGAGSGKTRVITTRTAYLIHTGLKPSSVLAVTFTNKAAKEMRERVRSMLTSGKGTPVISTFHSLCLRILRREIEHLGYRKDFTIYDTSDQVSLMRSIMADIKFYDKGFKAEAVLEKISRTKNDFAPSEKPGTDDAMEEAAALMYPRYREALKSMNALDFDDLLLLTLELFRAHPYVLDKYRQRFQYIMVDEYQDTNRIQYEFIKLLAGERRNICVVGDDDQSIYAWRGADISNILDFEKDFPGTAIVRLEQNYRSYSHILNAANGVIKNNRKRMEKSLWTSRGEGPKVNVFRALDTEDEAEWVAERISMIKDDRKIPYEGMAIIYRANIFSKPFEEALRSKRIPYTVVGGTSYFERREIKDLTAYLRVMSNPADDLSLLRVVNAPRRGLGPSALGVFSEFAKANGVCMLDAFGKADEISGLSRRARNSARSIFELINRYRELFKYNRGMGGTLSALIDETGYKDYVMRLYKTPEAAYRKIENINAFTDSVNHYESAGEAPSLQGFLETMALTDMIDEKEEKGGYGVTLISFHSAKGLEFPVVFIAGSEEDIIPHKKSVDTNDGIEEERRLFYVGITRAMKELFITHTERRKKYGKDNPSIPSRFLEEIPEDFSRVIDRYEEMDPDEEKAYVKSLYENFMSRFAD